MSSFYIVPVDIKAALKLPRDKRTISMTLYSDYSWIDTIKNSKIGYAPMTFVYTLFSPDYKNKIYFVDGNSKEEWISKINSSGVEYITFLKNYLHYKEWIESYPNNFELIYNGKDIMAYKVIKKEE
jgi:hypothetical protein